MAAIKAGLADGTIDAIATDHAPHTQEAKELPLDQAPPGMLGLETALALALTELDLPIEQVLALMSWQPARIARPGARPRRPLRVGADGGPAADLCVIDPAATWTVDAEPAGQPQPQHPLRRAHPHRPGPPHRLGGEPVVIDGEAQRW